MNQATSGLVEGSIGVLALSSSSLLDCTSTYMKGIEINELIRWGYVPGWDFLIIDLLHTDHVQAAVSGSHSWDN